MTPLTTKERRPLSREWRRHSLVKVRRPAWSDQDGEATASGGTSTQIVSEPQRTHTTHDDIAW
jgi:hypothetical protein